MHDNRLALQGQELLGNRGPETSTPSGSNDNNSQMLTGREYTFLPCEDGTLRHHLHHSFANSSDARGIFGSGEYGVNHCSDFTHEVLGEATSGNGRCA